MYLAGWILYNTRVGCEKRIKELKEDFGLESFCLQASYGTEASFHLIMVAYNLMSLFRHFAINHDNQATSRHINSIALH